MLTLSLSSDSAVKYVTTNRQTREEEDEEGADNSRTSSSSFSFAFSDAVERTRAAGYTAIEVFMRSSFTRIIPKLGQPPRLVSTEE